MPLKSGSSREVISSNIRELMHAGHEQAQAVAIAMKRAGLSRQDAEAFVHDYYDALYGPGGALMRKLGMEDAGFDPNEPRTMAKGHEGEWTRGANAAGFKAARGAAVRRIGTEHPDRPRLPGQPSHPKWRGRTFEPDPSTGGASAALRSQLGPAAYVEPEAAEQGAFAGEHWEFSGGVGAYAGARPHQPVEPGPQFGPGGSMGLGTAYSERPEGRPAGQQKHWRPRHWQPGPGEWLSASTQEPQEEPEPEAEPEEEESETRSEEVSEPEGSPEIVLSREPSQAPYDFQPRPDSPSRDPSWSDGSHRAIYVDTDWKELHEAHHLDVLKNPTQAEVNRWAGDDVTGIRYAINLRGGDVYAWDANSAIHHPVLHALGLGYYQNFPRLNTNSDDVPPTAQFIEHLREFVVRARAEEGMTAETAEHIGSLRREDALAAQQQPRGRHKPAVRAEAAMDRRVRFRDQDIRYYATEKLGKSRKITPEGYLLCEGTPIARTGEQVYKNTEIPLRADGDGLIVIQRIPGEVFREETIASFEGKPLTCEHPDEFVGPSNYKKYAVGHVQNVRRGLGIEDDLLLADLLITDPAAIAYVNKRLPEISAGYQSDYEQTETGRGLQRNILGNHVAFVESGRAGPRVSVRDEECLMSFSNRFLDGLRRLMVRETMDAVEQEESRGGGGRYYTRDERSRTLDEDDDERRRGRHTRDDDDDDRRRRHSRADDDDDDDRRRSRHSHDDDDDRRHHRSRDDDDDRKKVHDALEQIGERLKKLEAGHGSTTTDQPGGRSAEEEERQKRERGEAAGGAREQENTDTLIEAEELGKVVELGKVWTGDAIKELASRVEILAPGMALPTRDSLRKGRDTLSPVMRAALEKCATTDAGRDVVDSFTMGRKVADLKGHALLGVFNGASALMRVRNNDAARAATAPTRTRDFGVAVTPSEINKLNREFWAKQQQR